MTCPTCGYCEHCGRYNGFSVGSYVAHNTAAAAVPTSIAYSNADVPTSIVYSNAYAVTSAYWSINQAAAANPVTYSVTNTGPCPEHFAES